MEISVNTRTRGNLVNFRKDFLNFYDGQGKNLPIVFIYLCIYLCMYVFIYFFIYHVQPIPHILRIIGMVNSNSNIPETSICGTHFGFSFPNWRTWVIFSLCF